MHGGRDVAPTGRPHDRHAYRRCTYPVREATVRVIGIDACRRGWAGIVLDGDGTTTGVFLAELAAVDDLDVDGVGVDIPIGLAEDRVRAADVEARTFLGPRRASVFTTPVRAALAEPTHAAASATNREVTGSGISIQAWGLRRKVLEADEWARTTSHPVWEVHPEVAFTLLLGRPAAHPKTTWSGSRERRHALAAAGVDLGDVGEVGHLAASDDVLDAAAVAWSTRRLVRGEGRSWPDPPEHYDGWPHPVAIFA